MWGTKSLLLTVALTCIGLSTGSKRTHASVSASTSENEKLQTFKIEYLGYLDGVECQGLERIIRLDAREAFPTDGRVKVRAQCLGSLEVTVEYTEAALDNGVLELEIPDGLARSHRRTRGGSRYRFDCTRASYLLNSATTDDGLVNAYCWGRNGLRIDLSPN